MEEWKQIKDYPNYEISNTGQVRNKRGRILKPQENVNNYLLQVMLWKNSKAKCCYVHRLVAEHFLVNENPNEYTYVGHRNGDPHDNNADNLKWTDEKKRWWDTEEEMD